MASRSEGPSWARVPHDWSRATIVHTTPPSSAESPRSMSRVPRPRRVGGAMGRPQHVLQARIAAPSEPFCDEVPDVGRERGVAGGRIEHEVP
jgi:hypothetical protein